MKNTKTLILAALFAALTYVGTSIIKIPTPTMGYVHPGDAFVILSGVLLGPVVGGLAAGLGSMLSDLLGGYFIYAPATFIIKFLVAAAAGFIVKKFGQRSSIATIGGVIGEIFMVIGYFLFEIFLLAYSAGGSITSKTLLAGITSSAAGIPFNLVQAALGVVLAAILYPVLRSLLNKTLASE